jgi:hypothetical protein
MLVAWSTSGTVASGSKTWQLVSAILFFLAYSLIAFVSVRQTNLRWGSVQGFTSHAGKMLSETRESDLVDFAHDLEANVDILINKTALLLSARRANNAFFDFTHRYALREARSSTMLLLICSDPAFCAVLVTRCHGSQST